MGSAAGDGSGTASRPHSPLTLGRQVGQGAHSVVHRGRLHGQVVAIKVCEGEGALQRLRREAAAMARIQSAAVPAVHCTGLLEDGRAFLAMDWVDGPSLAQRLDKGPLPLEDVRRLLGEMGGVLRRTHEAGLVHRDLTPANILCTERGFVLIDFGLACRPRQATATEAGRTLVGTPAYAAPEQTGMLQVPVDGRADLYALGVVLFEALSGSRPFQADNVGELIRQHAVAPVPELDADVTDAWRQLVSRLLAKDPQDRHDDAAALLLATRSLDGDGVPPAQVGSREVRTGTAHGATLERLSRELAEPNGPAISLLRAGAGLGKSALLRALGERLQQRSQPVWTVDVETLGEQPLASFRELVRQCTRSVSSEVRHGLAQADPELHQAWQRLVPGLLDPPQAQASTEHANELHRAMHAAAELWRALSPRQPPVLLLDNAHGLDAESQRLLWHAASERTVRLVCGANPDEAQRLAAEGEPRIWNLQAVSVEAVHGLATSVLGPGVGLEQSRILHDQSLGRPGAAARLLEAWLDAGVLFPEEDSWLVDEPLLKEQRLPATVQEAALASLQRLSEEHLQALRTLSIFGRQVPRGSVAAFCDREASIAAAIQAGLLRDDQEEGLTFVHAVVQQRLCDELDEAERSRLHTKAAKWLDQYVEQTPAPADVWLYAWAEQSRISATKYTVPDAVRALRAAARRASQSASARKARELLEEARELAGAHGHPLDASFFSELGEAVAADGGMEDALTWFEQAANQSRSAPEKAALHLRLAHFSMFALRRMHTARSHCAQAWRLFGKPMPQESAWTAVRALWWILVCLFQAITGLRRGSMAGDVELQRQVQLCEITGIAAVYADRPFTMFHMQARLARYAHLLGDSREHVQMLAHWGNILGLLRAPRRWSARMFDMALAQARRLGDETMLARIEYFHCFTLPGFGEFADAERRAVQLIQRDLHLLDRADVSGFLFNYAHALQMRGYGKRSLGILEQALRKLGVDPERASAIPLNVLDAVIWPTAMHGDTERASTLMACAATEGPDVDPIMWKARWATRLQACFFANEFEHADEYLARWAEANANPLLAVWNSSHLWLAPALVLHAQLERSEPDEREQRLRLFRRALRGARLSSKSALSLCAVLSLRAEERSIAGRHAAAHRLLTRAEDTARAADAPMGLYLAQLVRASVLRRQGQEQQANLAAEAALDLAVRHGWPGLARRVCDTYELADPEARMPASRRSSGTRGTHSRTFGNESAGDSHARRERNALLRVSLATSGNLDPASQARAALDHLLDIFGAERAMLFEVGEDGAPTQGLGRAANRTDLDEDEAIAFSLVRRVASSGQPLVMTGSRDGEALGSASAVAQDVRSMICAPLHVGERVRGVVYMDSRLAKGVFTDADLEMLTAVAGQIAVAREASRSVRHEMARRDLERDLELTGTVQHLLLPRDTTYNHGPLHVAAHFQPAQQAGGDFWFSHQLEDGRVWIVVGDVTGHGTDAAMVTAAAVGALRALGEVHDNLATVLKQLHAQIRGLCRGRYMVSLTALELAPDGEIGVFSAGAPTLLQRRRDGQMVAHPFIGPLIGEQGPGPQRQQMKLEPGDRLLCATDGVHELELPSGRQLSPRVLAQLFQADGDLPLGRHRDELAQALEEQQGGHDQQDDITFVLLAYDPDRA